jgi:hypothetical protein
MQKEENDLRNRTKAFALRIARMFSELPKTMEAQVLGKQLLRSGTSSALTIEKRLLVTCAPARAPATLAALPPNRAAPARSFSSLHPSSFPQPRWVDVCSASEILAQ